MRVSIIFRILEFLIGALFVYAGVVKVLDPITFANDIDNYKTLPWMISVRLAFYLPWLEIFCGLALISRRLYLGGLTILTMLIVVFIVVSFIAKSRGIDISCGCFGHISEHFSFARHITIDFGIFAALVALWFSPAIRRPV